MIRKQMREMIGQMIMIGFPGAEPEEDSPVLKAVKNFSLGGVILYNIHLARFLKEKERNPDLSREEGARLCPRNILSAGQLQALSQRLQAAARQPLLIAVDQEGGLVSRLGPAAGFAEPPSARSLGEQGDLEETGRAARALASDLKRMGMNLNLAPVVDLDLNAEGLISRMGRSFGADPEKVYRHARAFILAHREEGILTCLKHFPGKGSAAGDTHLAISDVTSLYEPQEIHPFAWLIEHDLADSVMTSHIQHLGWDKEYPITLSPKVLRVLLREKMNYQGVIVSDDLLMEAIVQRFSLEEACVLAVEAGVDILLASNNMPCGDDPDLFARMYEALCQAVGKKRLKSSWIKAAYGRIQALKKKLS